MHIQVALKEIHAKELERLASEHDSKLNELKREHILQRDREKAAHAEQLKKISNGRPEVRTADT